MFGCSEHGFSFEGNGAPIALSMRLTFPVSDI